MPLTDDPHTARVSLSLTEKVVSLDQAAMSVPQGQRSFAANERVVSIDVGTRLIGNNLDLAVAFREVVVFDDRFRVDQGRRAIPNADRFTPPFFPSLGLEPKNT